MRTHLLKNKVSAIVFVAGLGYAGFAGVMYGGGPPAAMTNAPGESNCTSCHSGSLNPTPGNLVNLTLNGTFTGGGYIPDSTYTITLSYSQSGINKFGFQITSLTKGSNNPAGDFTAGTGQSKQTSTVSGKTRQYLNHNSSGTSGSGGRSWTFTWKAPSTNVDTIVFYAVVNATNDLNNNTGDQIYAKEFKIGPSSLLPTAIIQTSKSTVCLGDTVTFYGSGTNNTNSYRWKFQSGVPSQVTTQNVVRTYSTPGTFRDSLWVKNNKGESAGVVHIMTVLSKPSASIPSVVPGNTVCVGDTITLTANSGAGLRYSWNTGNPADTFQSVNITQSGSYEVTVTNSNGCSRTSAAVALTFVDVPAPTLTSWPAVDTVCAGDTMYIFADSANQTYDFYVDNVLVQSGASNFMALTTPGTHSIHVVADNGFCQGNSVNTLVRTIRPDLAAPGVTCGLITTDELNFHWSPVPGASRYEVSVDNGSFTDVGTDTFFQITGLSFNTQVNLRVRGIRTGLCAIGSLGMTNCTTLPCSQFSFGLELSDDTICSGEMITSTVRNLSLTNYEISFAGNPNQTDTSFLWNPVGSGTQALQIDIYDLNSPGCPAFTTYDTVFVDMPLPLQNLARTDSICAGDTLSLQASAGSGFFKHYFRNSLLEQSTQDESYVYEGLVNGDTIYYQVQGHACLSESPKRIIGIHPGITAEIHLDGFNKTWTFTDTSTGTVGSFWDFGDGNLGSSKTVTHTFADTGTFEVTLITTNSSGCRDTATMLVNSQNVGIHSPESLGYRFGPNPSSGVVWITKDDATLMNVRVYDGVGRLVGTQVLVDETGRVDLSAYHSGMYTLEVEYRGITRTHLLILNK